MPQLRQNLATKEWVIIATERAKRPEDFKAEKSEKKLPEFSPNCPFCPGNEVNTPGETLRITDKNGNWKIRIVPNKFPALDKEAKSFREQNHIFRTAGGYGYHEVLIETPKHNLTTALLPEEEIKNIITSYAGRYREIESDKKIHSAVIFKNHGAGAGTSLEHPHHQIVGMPVVPLQVRSRLEEAQRYYDDTGECVYCRMIEEELKAKERIILENRSFVVFTPFAAFSPFHTWILPKRHHASFRDISDTEIGDMAKALRIFLRKFYFGLNNPDFNYVIRSAPSDGRGLAYFHWYLSIVPRLTKTAGFELGSGMFINVSLPEENARFLRDYKLPAD